VKAPNPLSVKKPKKKPAPTAAAGGAAAGAKRPGESKEEKKAEAADDGDAAAGDDDNDEGGDGNEVLQPYVVRFLCRPATDGLWLWFCCQVGSEEQKKKKARVRSLRGLWLTSWC
jgi:hypothetical protein